MTSQTLRTENPQPLVNGTPQNSEFALYGLRLPLAFTLGLAALAFLPQIQHNFALMASFLVASAILVIWLIVLWRVAQARGQKLVIDVSLRPQHYLQAIAHTSIFVYWGIYWPPIQDAAALIIAQIVFAYAFDMLLTWSRRDAYTLGFGPFPIIFSTNLFLRFHDDWFLLQFMMVAVGFLAKELIRWDKDGRQVHIFNPSSFPLALFSLGLIVTSMTRITWGEDIASLLIVPPQIYLFIFLVSLPGQFLFRVTTMTLPAVLTAYLCSMAYLQWTGTYLFFDSNIPIAVFLGMHLLFTDPSTSPRTELGRIIFGGIYGLSVVGLYLLLGTLGAPTFYDKLLQVPIMNLMVKRIDCVAQSKPLAWLNPERLGAELTPRKRSFAYVSLWIVVFAALSAVNGIGDHHPGHTIPFWEKACRDNRDNACKNLAVLLSGPCRNLSGWSCNELGILVATGRVKAAPANQLFGLACENGFAIGCENAKALSTGAVNFAHGDPRLQDYKLSLGEGKGPIQGRTPFEIYTQACNQGWMAGCGSLAGIYFLGKDGVPTDKTHAAKLLEKACDGGYADSCSNLGLMYKRGDSLPADNTKAMAYLKQACDLGLVSSCRVLSHQGGR